MKSDMLACQRGQKTKGGSSYQPQSKREGEGARDGQPCMRCGNARHPSPDKNPALNATCHKCNRKGQCGHHCLSKTVTTSIWEVEATARKEILFKMDTGANIIVISKKVYHIEKIKLEKPSRILHRPACQPLEILGKFTGSLRLLHKDQSHVEDFFVVWDQHNNLLGWQQS